MENKNEEKEESEIDEGLLKSIWTVCFIVIITVIIYLVIFQGKPALLNHDINKAMIVYGGAIAFGMLGAFTIVLISNRIYWRIMERREKRDLCNKGE